MKFLHTLAEGGQTWAHRIRMLKQVLKLGLSMSLLIASIYFGWSSLRINPILYQNGYYRLKAEIASLISIKSVSVPSKFWEKISHERIHETEKIVSIKYLQTMTDSLTRYLLNQGRRFFLQSLITACFSFVVILLFFLMRGILSKRKRHISGKTRRHHHILRLQLLLTRKASDIKIASLPLVKGSETQHILVTGGTGTGKTNTFHHLLPQIRQKAIIIDTTGTFVDKYYIPTQDVLLNPFEQRGSSWHPWIECKDPFDFDNLAESMIPQSHHDQENYWRTAARTLLSSLLQKLTYDQKTSELTRWLLYEPLDKLSDFIQNTKAAAHIDIHSEKTAASIRSVAASFLSFLEYLPDTSAPFSIKQWIQDPTKNNWLFLYTKPSQRAAMNALIAGWFSIGVRSLLQMNPDLDRRVWFIIDELPVLQKLKELESLVTESRKYGGCALLALQSPSQLEEIYGRATAHTIIGNCATRIVFAEHDPEISERISKSLGECEIKEYQEGLSYGAHEVRDGVNLTLQTKKIPTITPTEIQSLENNHAFIKLPGNLPISKISFKKK